MVLSVNTNTLSLFAQGQMAKSSAALGVATERLSSGLKINSAKDDAAGMAIANRMQVNLRAASQTSVAINNGVSLTQIAAGGLNGINELLQRAHELAIQGSTGTLSDADRATVNSEFHSLREDIDRIAHTTEVFGKFPLAPTGTPVDIVMSANYGQAAQKVSIAPTPSDSATLGIDQVELDPLAKAREALDKLQAALQQVDASRSQYGALQNQFDSAIQSLAQEQLSTTTAHSRIMDADYATETSNLVRSQLMQQAGMSVLAKSNAFPKDMVSALMAS